MVEKIRFQISPEGEVSVNVECAVGKKCETLTRPFEEKIGIVTQKEYKDEFYAETETTQMNEVEGTTE